MNIIAFLERVLEIRDANIAVAFINDNIKLFEPLITKTKRIEFDTIYAKSSYGRLRIYVKRRDSNLEVPISIEAYLEKIKDGIWTPINIGPKMPRKKLNF